VKTALNGAVGISRVRDVQCTYSRDAEKVLGNARIDARGQSSMSCFRSKNGRHRSARHGRKRVINSSCPYETRCVMRPSEKFESEVFSFRVPFRRIDGNLHSFRRAFEPRRATFRFRCRLLRTRAERTTTGRLHRIV